MSTNRSPWLHQLDKERVPDLLTRDIETDIAIVGAGIAGISTAFFLLKNTNRRVIVLERGRLAHGATGHNAGQVVSYFECGFANLEERFGLALAAAGQKSVEDAWELIDEMYVDAGLDIPFYDFLGMPVSPALRRYYYIYAITTVASVVVSTVNAFGSPKTAVS